MPNTLTNDQIISAAYVALFQRAPDQEGLNNWRAEALRQQEEGKTEVDLAKAMASLFSQHPAFTTIYGDLGDAAFIDAIYMNIGGKVADDAGRANWLARLSDPANPITRGELVGEFIYGVLSITPEELQALQTSGEITLAELTDALARQDRLTNKAEVALLFTQTMGVGSNLTPGTDANSLESLQQDPAYVASQAIISSVTEDDATMTAPSAYLNGTPTISGVIETFGGNVPGAFFALKVGVDTINGTIGNDTIDVPYVNILGTPATTWEAYDTIKGGKGVDTMNIYVNNFSSAGINSAQASTVESVEIINAYNAESGGYVFGGSAIDASKFVGAEQIWQIDGNTDVTGLAATTTAGFRGNADIDVALTAAANAASINVAFDAPTYAGSGSAAVHVNANGAALNAVNLSGALGTDFVNLNIGTSTAEVALTTDFDLTVGFSGNTTLNTLNAAAVNGDVEVNGLAQLTSITTGSGDDEVGITTSALNTSITTNAGDDIIGVLAVETDPPTSPVAGTGSITIDAGEGDNVVLLENGSKNISITAGSGNDIVLIDEDASFADAASLTINIGDSNGEFLDAGKLAAAAEMVGSGFGFTQLIDLQHGAATTSITTGSGSDLLNIAADVLEEATTLTADLGAGDDLLMMDAIEFADIPATWSINAGSGDDIVVLNAGEGRTFVAGDYVALTENLQGFETLVLTDTQDAGDATAFNVDASRLTGYEAVIFGGDGSYNLTKVTDQVIGVIGGGDLNINASGDTSQNLTVEAMGYDDASTDITAVGNTLDLTVTGEIEVELFGNLQTANVTLEGSSGDAWVNFDINHPNGSGGADSNLINLSAITLDGWGNVDINHHTGGALKTVDASNLNGSLWYDTDNSAVAEAVTLGNGFDWVGIDANTSFAAAEALADAQADASDADADLADATNDLLTAYANAAAFNDGDTLDPLTPPATADAALAQSNAINLILAGLEQTTDDAATSLESAYGNLTGYFNFLTDFDTSLDASEIADLFTTDMMDAELARVDALNSYQNLMIDYGNAYTAYDAADADSAADLVIAYMNLQDASDEDNFTGFLLDAYTDAQTAADAIANEFGDGDAEFADGVLEFNSLFDTADAGVTPYTDAFNAEDAFSGLNDAFDTAATAYDAADGDATTAESDLAAALADAAEATSFGSTVLHTDVITGLTLNADAELSDIIKVETDLVFGDAAEFVAITQDLSTFGTLNLALQAVAQSADDLVVFQYQGNTYIYGDKASPVDGTLNQLDDTDLLVKLTGTVDLTLLTASLNDFVIN